MQVSVKIPLKVDVPLATILELSAETEIENADMLTELAAMLHLVCEQSSNAPRAIAEAVCESYECDCCAPPKEVAGAH